MRSKKRQRRETISSRKNKQSLLLFLQIGVVLGILSYDTYVSLNPLVYYGMRILFIFFSMLLLYVNRKLYFSNSVIFIAVSVLFVFHTFQSLTLDLFWPGSENTITFTKMILPRALFFLAIYITLRSLKTSSSNILRPIMYLGTLLSIQGLIGCIIIYCDVPVPINLSTTSVADMVQIGPFGIFGYGQSIYGPILRVQSIFAECNVFGRFLGVAMWTTFAIYLTDRQYKYLIYLLLQSICFLLTYSLSAYIALLLSILLWWILAGKRSLLLLKSILSIFIIIGIVISLLRVVPTLSSELPENESYKYVAMVMSRYTFENIHVERPMAGPSGIYEFITENPFGEGFSIYGPFCQSKGLGTGSALLTWIRLGGAFSILIWISLFTYLVIKNMKRIQCHHGEIGSGRYIFVAIILYLVSSISTGSFLEIYFLFYLALIGVKFFPNRLARRTDFLPQHA